MLPAAAIAPEPASRFHYQESSLCATPHWSNGRGLLYNYDGLDERVKWRRPFAQACFQFLFQAVGEGKTSAGIADRRGQGGNEDCAEEGGVTGTERFHIAILLVVTPRRVRQLEQLATFDCERLELTFPCEGVEKLRASSWVGAQNHPFAFIGAQDSLIDHFPENLIGRIKEWFKSRDTFIT